MRKMCGMLLLLVAFTSACLADVTISVVDYDKSTKTVNPIPGMTVRVSSSGKSKEYKTDGSGQIKLPDGTYDVLVNPTDSPGYDSNWDTPPLVDGLDTDLDIVVSPTTSPVK